MTLDDSQLLDAATAAGIEFAKIHAMAVGRIRIAGPKVGRDTVLEAELIGPEGKGCLAYWATREAEDAAEAARKILARMEEAWARELAIGR